MAKPKTPNQKHKYSELNKRLAKYVMLVESIYEDLNLEAAKIVGITDFTIDSDRPFMWSDYPQTRKRIRDLQERFVEDIGAVIYSGTSEEWKNSNEVQDLLANKVLQTYGATIGKKNYEILYQPNNDALKAFQQRKDKGFTISDKLWNQSILYKQELEEAISCAIQKGTSAITLSKQISKYLLDFPQLQKDYKERFGKASRSMDCEYRSIRLAASEINMAYRQAENLRWQQMDFVVGYEIKLSNNHTCNGKPFQDICDILAGKYPKDFQWTGWHPLCYSDDSEVLTNRGWKLFKDVLDDDLILSLNPESRNVEWVGISDRQCYKYEGEMIHFFNRSLDCLVTPEHQMVYLNKGDGRIEHQAAAAFDQSKGALFRGRTGVDVKYDIHLTFNKESVAYDGYVYDLTLAENHIMYIRRNGKCFWGSNCRCYKIPILKTEEEFWEWDGRSEATTASVNEVKDVPDAFKKWVLDNQERISTAKKRNTLPYFLKDNPSFIKEDKSIYSHAITKYTGSYYPRINQYLRGQRKQLDDDALSVITDVSKYLSLSEKYSGISYRGIVADRFVFEEFKSLNKGNIFSEKGFMSTSIDKLVANDFAEGTQYKIIFEIKGKNGVDISSISDIPDEKEVLFNKGSKFKITKITKSDNKTYGNIYITMEEI
jgi:hypothetical protein